MPRPVQELLRLVHVERLDLSKVRGEDLEIVQHMKAQHPQLYQSLKKAVRAKRRKPEESQH